ncbi:Uncharacterized conserved protein [Devosia sp. YR412]|uniref:GFA family protein n=1 Tax=Devosia sp. YR412 TaxID=1881030 RepID=UPI0008D8970F|nr:aldehyde-activating protein [Devosia sp. YR412]SEQ05979.1 Uncharacterized conserved protein [Devosia sp. YR412]
MSLTATCHCGDTSITLPHAPESAGECNCTFCSRTGAVWGYFKPGELTITAKDHDRFYSATGMNQHHFCAQCGMQTWGVSPDWASMYNSDGTPKNGDPTAMPTGQIFAVNLRLIDDFDWESVEVEKMDGRNSW